MGGSLRDSDWLPTVLAAVAFAVFAVAFFYEIVSYQEMVVGWAYGDINSRAHLAASNLTEPLRTQDFGTIRRIGAACEADGVHLLVTSERGGVFYDSRPKGAQDRPFYSERCPSGEYQVSVGMPQTRVRAPFKRAVRGFFLAGLVGVAGVLLFFFVTYRQRVRIRELKRLEKFRREFIADVSHEIKTPLTGILGAVDMMEEAKGQGEEAKGQGEEAKGQGEGERRKVLLDLIRNSAKRLNGLVQSILDLARLEREGEILNRTETDLGGLVREVAARYGVVSAVRGGDAASTVYVDAQLIEQAVSNLVENAKRHSGTDDISVSVSHSGGVASVSVADHGVGVPPEEAERIFERFHRIDPARAAETGGAGLGLAIVRRIARLHGGDVTLAAAKPHGAVFTLTLPCGSDFKGPKRQGGVG